MKLVLSSLLTFVVLFSGCSGRQVDVASVASTNTAPVSAPATVMQQGQQQDRERNAQANAVVPAKFDEPQASDSPANIPTERKIIRNGEFAIETKTPTEDQRKLQAIAEALGGFVVTSEFKSSTNRSDDSTTVSVILRVPSANFQKATDEIVKLVTRVLHQKTTGNDVTAEFVDLEARLRAKKALESQYFEIMKRASKISDVLEVQEKLTEVRTEIEQAEGRRRYLENQSALSTINISLPFAFAASIGSRTSFSPSRAPIRPPSFECCTPNETSLLLWAVFEKS